eukprot:SAG11_NODE_6691_length_1265_cov_4.034305_1_plen_128_part_01
MRCRCSNELRPPSTIFHGVDDVTARRLNVLMISKIRDLIHIEARGGSLTTESSDPCFSPGGDVSSSGSDFADRLDVLERNQRDMPANVKQSIARDVAEHRFAVAGDGSVGTLRKTLAFSMDAEHFYLY